MKHFYRLSIGTFVTFQAAFACSFSMSDIVNWSGSGSNRSALVIEWSAPEVLNNTSVSPGNSTAALAWGYHFDDSATAKDMLHGILASDSRLYAVTGYGGDFILGFGYDYNNDGQFALSNGSTTYTGDQIRSGLANDLDADSFSSVSSGDLYWGGLLGPNWELWTEAGQTGGLDLEPDRGSQPYWTPDDPSSPWSGRHGGWEFAQYGVAGLDLKNGSWIGFSVASGGLDYGNPDSAGSQAWYFHKRAPGEAQAAPEPISLTFLGLTVVGVLVRRRRTR